MRNITIDLDTAARGLARVVSTHGSNHTATGGNGGDGCKYARMESGVLNAVCIVGQFIANLGFLGALLTGDENVLDYEGYPYQTGACMVENEIWTLLAEHGLHFTPEARSFLYRAQREQDAGEPWGTALYFAYLDHKDALDSFTVESLRSATTGHKVPVKFY